MEEMVAATPGHARQRRTRWAAAALVVVVVMTAGYFALSNTVIADIRERLIAPDQSNSVAYGKVLFSTRGCVGCHTLGDAGATGKEGPILDGIASRHDAAYLRMVITDPSRIGDAVCPNGPCRRGIMPVWGNILSPAQIEALAQYLMQQK